MILIIHALNNRIASFTAAYVSSIRHSICLLYTYYQVPAEALTDDEFAAIYKEAQKYVGTPYVLGGSTPETGFDCSGYVCWVYNQNGYDVGRTTANGCLLYTSRCV